MEDQFYGDRTGTVIDPFGHKWSLATHIEDVNPEEMKRRMAKMGQSQYGRWFFSAARQKRKISRCP